MLNVISAAAISVKDMQNTIFDDTGAAVASITLEREPTEATLSTISSACPQVLGALWIPFDGGATLG